VSDDGRAAISVIVMLGSVFSPFYAAARARGGGRADPLAHAAVNVAIYAPGGDRWVLTERGERALTRSGDALSLGPSRVRWEGDALVLDLDERAAPIGRRVAGRIRLIPEERAGDTVILDAAGRHRWVPIAPSARAEVELTHPSLRFRGAAYLDSNAGDEALEEAFTGWTWARVASAGRAAVTYEVARRDGSRLLVTRAFERGGARREGFPVVSVEAAPTRWRMPRRVHGEPGARPRILRTLEDTPFYARSLIETRFFGERAVGTHEALSLDRFRSRPVQFMLPYRMRREVT
jgi:carotenoid 1,2-hydratase